MQHFDAWIDPATHQVQQTIYMASYNDKPAEKDDIFRILAQRAAAGGRGQGRAGGLQARDATRPRRATSSKRGRGSRLRSHGRPAQPPPAPPQRGVARAAVRADRAGLHADRGRDGDDQPRARVAVRAGHVRRAVHRHAEARARSPTCRRGTSRCRSALAISSRSSSRRWWSGSSACCSSSACAAPTADPLYGLLLTFGAALVIEEVIRARLGLDREAAAAARGDLRRVPGRRPDLLEVPLLRQRLRGDRLILALWLFLEKTPYGAMIKAGAHDSEMVRALGINLSRLRLFVFALGTALAAVAGIVHGADLGRPAARGRRRGGAGLPDHRARRRRQLLGRGARRARWWASSSGSPAPTPRNGR